MVAFQTSTSSAAKPAPSSWSVTIGSGALFGGGVEPSASAGRMRGIVGARPIMSWKTKCAVSQASIWSRSNPKMPWLVAPPLVGNNGAVIVYEFWLGQIPNFG